MLQRAAESWETNGERLHCRFASSSCIVVLHRRVTLSCYTRLGNCPSCPGFGVLLQTLLQGQHELEPSPCTQHSRKVLYEILVLGFSVYMTSYSLALLMSLYYYCRISDLHASFWITWIYYSHQQGMRWDGKATAHCYCVYFGSEWLFLCVGNCCLLPVKRSSHLVVIPTRRSSHCIVTVIWIVGLGSSLWL